jgi:predicted acylesterase/phospholipase RssA
MVPLTDAIMASASIPFVFAPVKLSSQNYIDGGLRAAVPVAAAMASGATRVYAVLANHNVVGPAIDPITNQLISSFDNASLLSIAARAAEDIMPSQIEADNIAPPTGWGATDVVVIEPDFLVHNGMTIDPGHDREHRLLQPARGYAETHRAEQGGFRRVFFRRPI